ncbi:unnamed protein product, partial [Heterotrigona itama]
MNENRIKTKTGEKPSVADIIGSNELAIFVYIYDKNPQGDELLRNVERRLFSQVFWNVCDVCIIVLG